MYGNEDDFYRFGGLREAPSSTPTAQRVVLQVIKRAEWPVQPRTAGALLTAMAKIAPVDKEVLDRLDTAQGLDRPPEDPWRGD